MHAKIFSATTIGVNAQIIEVEVDIALGLINFYLVGLPDTAVKESSKRIIAALKNCGIPLPAKKITVNLAPADVKKEGTLFDVPIALGILRAAQMINPDPSFIQETLIIGELSLDGGIRGIKGALAIACDAHKLGKKRIIVPEANAHEAAIIDGLEVIGVNHLTQLVGYLRQEIIIEPTRVQPLHDEVSQDDMLDFLHVKGQQLAKRALQISAAGRHNILFIGPPGSGKTMLAQRLPSIMPPMSFHEMIEASKIYSITGKLGPQRLITRRPFRAPHHTISSAGLIGGGSYPQPGEVSLAHHGILFLDELTEFKRYTLEVLRQPLEQQNVHISRAQQSLSFPASFLLVAALNPCPCGYWGDKKRNCSCSPHQISAYFEKLSGPLLDRIDLQINVQAVDYSELKNTGQQQTSAMLFGAVQRALDAQQSRFGNSHTYNSTMSAKDLVTFCALQPDAETLIKKAFDTLHISMRGYHKILKVARTIADLEGSQDIQMTHIKEAIMYRSLDQHRHTVHP